MIKIVICDDEQEIVEFIYEKVTSIMNQLSEFSCYKVTKPQEVLQVIKTVDIDILLIDIEMPEMDGFKTVSMVKKQNRNILIIFITNMDMQVYESLKYHPFRFIRKTHIKEMKEALTSAVMLINNSKEKFSIQISSLQNISISLDKIIYFESVHNDVKVITINEEYKFRSTLKCIEKRLESKGFIRIHSGYLLNIKYIHLIKKGSVTIYFRDKKLDLPVSRGQQDNLVLKYQENLR